MCVYIPVSRKGEVYVCQREGNRRAVGSTVFFFFDLDMHIYIHGGCLSLAVPLLFL